MEHTATVLIVDDEPFVRQALGALLAGEQYAVEYAGGGTEALAKIAAGTQPDILLLDLMMPDLDGHEVCRRLKADPQTAHIPIIMVTAVGDKRTLAESLCAGADDFISKPATRTELLARVRSMLRLKRQHDELVRLMRVREDMVHMIVHDMRNPLSGISIYGQLLESADNLLPNQRSWVERIRRDTGRLERFTNEILITAQADDDKLTLHRVPVELTAWLREFCDDQRGVAEARRLHLHLDLPSQPRTVEIDADLFSRVVDNLLSNTLKFSPPGGRVDVCLRYPDAQAGFCLDMADQGPGISPEHREEVFDRFRVVDLKKQGVPQVGLGLAFCKLVVEAHGGRIFVAANEPVGSVFTIDLAGPTAAP